MATKKRKAPQKSRKRKMMERAGIAVLKSSGSAAMGATVGIVEEAVGEKAGLGTRAAMAAAGLATEIFVDPLENPILSEAGKASLHTASGVTAYKAAKAVTRKSLDAKAERDHDKMVDRLRSDMEDDTEEETKKAEAAAAAAKTKAKAVVVAKKPAAAAKKTAA